MKKTASVLTFFVIVATAFSLFTAIPAKAAPAPAPAPVKLSAVSIPITFSNGRSGICVIQPNGEKVCYEYTDPSYTDPTYSCPQGSTQIENDPTHCLVTTTGTVYTARPQVPATYKCPDGYAQSGTTCSKLVTAGYWDTVDRPVTTPADYVCPGPFTFTASRYTCPNGYKLEGTVCTKNGQPDVPATLETYSSGAFSYDKSNDPNKCHLPTGVKNEVPSWAMNDFNGQFEEWLDAIYVPPTYGSCPDGYAVAPDTSKCQKWVPPVYDYTDMIVDVAAHPGSCPDGYEVFSDTLCSKQVTENQTIDATVSGRDPYCTVGTLINGQCASVVTCPPVDMTTICYQGETIEVPTDTLGQYEGYTAGACVEPEKPKCLIGWEYVDQETGEVSCRVTNWDFCNYIRNVHCQRHLDKFAGFEDTQLVLLRYRANTLANSNFPFEQAFRDRLAAK